MPSPQAERFYFLPRTLRHPLGWVLVIVVIVAVLTLGLASRVRRIARETRIRSELSNLPRGEKLLAHPLQAIVHHGLSQALAEATPESLSCPRVAVAVLRTSQNESGAVFVLWVQWVESYPSVVGITLGSLDGGDSLYLPVPDRWQATNRRHHQERDTIVFESEWAWASNEVPRPLRTQACQLRLLSLA